MIERLSYYDLTKVVKRFEPFTFACVVRRKAYNYEKVSSPTTCPLLVHLLRLPYEQRIVCRNHHQYYATRISTFAYIFR